MSGPAQFYLDEHVPHAVARALRQRGINVVTVAELERIGWPDDAHLEAAMAAGRVVVTRDDDFLRFDADGRAHAGIAYAPRGVTLRRIIEGLFLIHGVLDADAMAGHIEHL